MFTRNVCWSVIVAALVVAPWALGAASPDSATQSLTLKPGWNAVFLELRPDADDCDTVFANLPVESVWAWNEHEQPVQYVRDPSTLMPQDPAWLAYFPPSSQQAFLRSLHRILGGRAYLIKLAGSAPIDWNIVGRLAMRAPAWVADSFNLVGFQVDPNVSPTMKDYFAPSPAHGGQPIYRLNAAGQWEPVADPASAKITRGEAYWVYCKGASKYVGPFTVESQGGEGLDYGSTLTELPLRLKNDSSHSKTVTIQLQPSNRPSVRPTGDSASSAGGAVPLSVCKVNTEKQQASWEALDGPLSLTMDAKSEQDVRLAVRRSAMPAPASSDTVFQSELLVSDSQGGLYRMPVYAAKALSPAGLWVGSVAAKAVSEAANPEDSVTPKEVPSEFHFRIVVHVDATGKANLLQEVLLMQLQATYKTDPDDSTHQIVDQPMRYVLLTNDALIPEFQGSALRDGELVGRRISSPVFGFKTPILMTGSLGQQLACTVSMAYDDPVNPFLHRYHPDHDNLDERFEVDLGAGKESYNFSRKVTLEFSSTDPDGMSLPNWGDDQVGGIYHEELTGVHINKIYIKGTFRLQQICRVGVLNDGR